MTNTQFGQLVKQAINKLRPKARELLKECHLSIMKYPPKDLQTYLFAFGCFRGKPKGTIQGGFTHASIELYKDDILFCNRFKRKIDLVNHITDILAHELTHYLGCPEGDANLNLDLFKKNIKKEELDVKKNSHKRRSWLPRWPFGRPSD